MTQNSSPTPQWTPGAKVSRPLSEEIVSLNASDLSPQERYRILISTIIPRPIALISTQSADGKNNLAPFSFFNGVSSNPATVMVSIAVRPDGVIKDTLRNILETKEFVVNSANEWLIEPLVYSAGYFDYGVDEMKEAGLTPVASDLIKPFRVKESAAQFECTLYNQMKIGDGSPGSSTVVIGEIKKFHLAASIYKNGKVSREELKAIGRLGGISYTRINDEFELAIPEISGRR